MCFNRALKQFLNQTLSRNTNSFCVIEVYGPKGSGKSTAIEEVLRTANMQHKIITFSKDNLCPFQDMLSKQMEGTEDEQYTAALSELLQQDTVLVLADVEWCMQDHVNMIARVLNYHQICRYPAHVILEQNGAEPLPFLQALPITDRFSVKPIPPEVFQSYLAAHFQNSEANPPLFQKIIDIANGNIRHFFIVLNILLQENIISRNGIVFVYNQFDHILPKDLLGLCRMVFDHLEQNTKRSLCAAAPFSSQIYTQLVEMLVQSAGRCDFYLKELSQHDSLITQSLTGNQLASYQSQYEFTTPYARNAVCERIPLDEYNQFIQKYYDCFDRVYHNSHANLSEIGRVQLALHLVRSKEKDLTINQIPLIVDIMTYCYEHFMYYTALKYGKLLLDAHVLNHDQLNAEYHGFYLIYFKTLLAVGQYGDILNFDHMFHDEDLNYYIALAYYNNGSPIQALKIIQQNWGGERLAGSGYKNMLLSSIYDWIGDNKASLKQFKLAIKACNQHLDLKYQLYKRYSMHIDFRLPECQEKMRQAANYYRIRQRKQYAECMHNLGTGYIMIGQHDQGRKCLQKSKKTLEKICDSEIYHPINSIAISLCFANQAFEEAIQLWESCLRHEIPIDFCRIALKNNLMNAYIHQALWKQADQLCDEIRREFVDACHDDNLVYVVAKVRPDLQHPLRQFYYNQGIYWKAKGERDKASACFSDAKRCSQYHSVVEYAIEQNIRELTAISKHQTFLLQYLPHKALRPTEQERFIYEHDIYLCEVMFWG